MAQHLDALLEAFQLADEDAIGKILLDPNTRTIDMCTGARLLFANADPHTRNARVASRLLDLLDLAPVCHRLLFSSVSNTNRWLVLALLTKFARPLQQELPRALLFGIAAIPAAAPPVAASSTSSAAAAPPSKEDRIVIMLIEAIVPRDVFNWQPPLTAAFEKGRPDIARLILGRLCQTTAKTQLVRVLVNYTSTTDPLLVALVVAEYVHVNPYGGLWDCRCKWYVDVHPNVFRAALDRFPPSNAQCFAMLKAIIRCHGAETSEGPDKHKRKLLVTELMRGRQLQFGTAAQPRSAGSYMLRAWNYVDGDARDEFLLFLLTTINATGADHFACHVAKFPPDDPALLAEVLKRTTTEELLHAFSCCCRNKFALAIVHSEYQKRAAADAHAEADAHAAAALSPPPPPTATGVPTKRKID